MATQTIYIQLLTEQLDSALNEIFKSGKPVGYVPLSNKQFYSFMYIGLKKHQLSDPRPSVGVSDFGTNVGPGDTIQWQILTFPEPPIFPPVPPPIIQNLSIDLISIYDAANAPIIFPLPITPLPGSANQIWTGTVSGLYQNNELFPHSLSYKIQFSFVYDGNYYYFQFDPLIEPKPKS